MDALAKAVNAYLGDGPLQPSRSRRPQSFSSHLTVASPAPQSKKQASGDDHQQGSRLGNG